MGLIDWRILVLVASIGLIALAFGVRGRRLDSRPRCKRRRCRYELTSFLGESRPGSGYPATCPECGRVADSDRDVKWGKRRARRWVVVVGAMLLALAATPVGIELRARATNANPYAWMPTWYLIGGVERDTQSNGFNHQKELLRRADADEISDAAAERLTKKILEWQRDENVYWGTLGDVFASLTLNGKTTPEDVKEFWEHIWRFEVVGRPVVAFGEAPLIQVHGIYRGQGFRQLILRVSNGDDVWLPTHFGGAFSIVADLAVMSGDETFPVGLRQDQWMNAAQGYIDGAGLRSVWHPWSAPDAWDAARSLHAAYIVRVAGEATPTSISAPMYTFATPEELKALGLRTSWPVRGDVRVEPVEAQRAEVELVDRPGMRAALASDAKAILRIYHGQPDRLDISLGSGVVGPAWMEARTPLDLAVSFEVLIRLPDGTTPRRLTPEMLVSRTLPASISAMNLYNFQQFWMTNLSTPGSVILRANPAGAGRTADITRILGGEIEIPIIVDHVPPGAPMPRPGEMSQPVQTPPVAAPGTRPTP